MMGRELRVALRRLRFHPANTLVVIATIGLGLGAALAVFPLADAILLRPLPYPDQHRLVRITQSVPVAGMPELPYSDVGFRRLTEEVRSLAAVAAYDTRDANLLERGSPRRLVLARVSAAMFDVLGMPPRLGRSFNPAEDRPGGPRLLVLSDRLWRTAFNADSAVVGQRANLEGEPYTIIGVLDPAVAVPSREIAAWEPLQLDGAGVNPYRANYRVLGRLAPGAALEQTRRDVTESLRAVGRDYPGPHPGSALDPAGYHANLRPLAEDVVSDARPIALLLAVGVTLLLLLTCANVVNLQIAATVARGEEIAVRAALGAGRGRLIREAVLEGSLLAAGGAVVALGCAAAGAGLLRTLMPAGLAIDGPFVGIRTVLAAAAAVLLIGATVGALPVLLMARRDLARALRDRTASGSARAHRTRLALAAGQVALAVALTHGAALLIASARAMRDIELGFRPDSAITLRINMGAEAFADRPARETRLRLLLAELQQLPGVATAGLVNALPLTRGRQDQAMAVEGRPFKADGTDPVADYRVASTGYFDAMGIALEQGRLFTDDDATEFNTPVLISSGLARQLFPDGGDPVGHRLRFGPAAPWMPIIGVVADARNRSLTESPRPELYFPALGNRSPFSLRSEFTVVVRTRARPEALVPAIRAAIGTVLPEAPIYHVATLAAVVGESRAQMTTATTLISGYAAGALALAIAGTYAMLSFLVTLRRREIAVRLALGAEPRAVIRMVARQSARLIGTGVIAGLAGAIGLARLLGGLLYGVRPLDGTVVLAVLVAAAAAGVLAAVVPAHRAARLDPAAALRGLD